MRIAYFEPLSRAWERTRVILWQPFDLAKWLLLAFSAWLAGLTTDFQIAFSGADDRSSFGRHAWPLDVHSWDEAFEGFLLLPLIAFGIMFGLAISILVLWVSSRAKMMFLDGVVMNRVAISESWKRLESLGNALFIWRLCFSLAILVTVLVLMAAFFLPAAGFSMHEVLDSLSAVSAFLGVMALVVLAIVAIYIALLTESFVVPIMYRYELNALEGWRAFLPWLKARPLQFVVYGLFVLLLLVLTVGACCFWCINLLPYIGKAILLPVWVCYRLFSVEFLAQFHPDFDLFRPLPEDAEEAITGLAE